MPFNKKQASTTSLSESHSINWRPTAYQGYNGLVAALVLYQYFTNPEARVMEHIPDIAIHLFEAFAPNSLNTVGAALNGGRLYQAGVAFFSGDSSIPSVANVADVCFHGINMYHRLSQ